MMRTRIGILATAACALLARAAASQTLSGTVVAGDTGAAITGARILAIQKTASLARPPVMYRAVTDAGGRYSMTVSAGQYELCVHEAGVYLNPCQWGTRVAVTVPTAAQANLRLQKGAWFIVRIHGNRPLFSRGEAVRGAAASVLLTSAAVSQFPLPLIYSDERVRDYGAVVPMNVAMRARIASTRLVLNDRAGSPLSSQGVPFQVTAADFPTTNNLPSALAHMFPPPTAKFVHVYAAGRK